MYFMVSYELFQTDRSALYPSATQHGIPVPGDRVFIWGDISNVATEQGSPAQQTQLSFGHDETKMCKYYVNTEL